MTVLRPYQTTAIARARQSIASGKRAPLIVSPAGSGKTTIGAEIARLHLERDPGNRVLWLAHRRELVEQAADRLEAMGMRVGEIRPNPKRCNPYMPVQVASIQTLVARGNVPPASLVVVDEAHHFAASTGWYDIASRIDGARRIGLTATPERGDGQGLGDMFDDIVVAASIRELTDAGHLVPLRVVAPLDALESGTVAQKPVDAWLEHARGRRTVVFMPHVKAARICQEEFCAVGVDAGVVHGETAVGMRSQLIERFASGQMPVLINVFVLCEGWDCPETDCCIIARGCGHPGLYIQMVGRIMRPAPEKTDALLLDLRGICHVHGAPDIDRLYSLEGHGIRRAEEPEERFCQVCGVVLPPSGICEDCGKAPNELAPDVVVNAPLIEFDKFAKKREEPPEARAKTLARWMRVAKTSGFKPGWAAYRYKATYGAFPDRSMMREAEGMVA